MEIDKLRLIFKFVITIVLATFVSEYSANPDLTVAVIGLMWTDFIKDISEAYVKVKNE